MNMTARPPRPSGDSAPELAEFLVTAPAEIAGLLDELAERKLVLALSAPGGAHCTSTVTSLDPARGLLCLSADENDPRLQGLLESDEVLAMAYLDSVKLQFDLQDLVLVHSDRGCALNARLPREMYRIQRRGSFRVRPLINTRPTASMRHPVLRDMQLELRVIDVSIGGLALFLPDTVPAIAGGLRIEQVQIELDGDTRLTARLIVHHITQLHQESLGVRLGCEMQGLSGEDSRALQRYIDLTQKRRRLLVM